MPLHLTAGHRSSSHACLLDRWIKITMNYQSSGHQILSTLVSERAETNQLGSNGSRDCRERRVIADPTHKFKNCFRVPAIEERVGGVDLEEKVMQSMLR
jgi:hypothetical protein